MVIIKLGDPGDFPGGPVVKTLCFHCRGNGFDPSSGEIRSCMPQDVAKKTPKKSNTKTWGLREERCVATGDKLVYAFLPISFVLGTQVTMTALVPVLCFPCHTLVVCRTYIACS